MNILPKELFEEIIDFLSFSDMRNLSLVCKELLQKINRNLWMKKIVQTALKKKYLCSR